MINDPKAGLGEKLFSMELLYNDPGGNLRNTKLYNGNISQSIWKTASDNSTRYYNYYYDDLNRIKRANYYSWSERSRFNGSFSYDKNGNLLRLYRRGAVVENPEVRNYRDYGTMDNLNYTYDGNQLTKVKDFGKKQYGFIDGADTDQEYVYDLNGNMTSDANKEISKIYYNHLNLPTKIEFETKRSVIYYTYDASGSKLKKEVARYGLPSKFTEYAGNYIYENNELQFFNHSEGYATPNNLGKFDYIYQYKDHLGNVRLSYTKNPNSNKETIFTDGFESMSTWDKTNNSFGHSLTALDTTKKKSGRYSGRIDDNYPANWEKYVYSDTWTPINNSQDTYYTVSGWIYVENVANNDAQIWLSTRKSGETGYPSGNYSSKTTQRGRWEYLSKTVLVPADVRELNIRIDNNKKGKVWFDDVKIVKGNTSQTVIVEESNYYPFGLQHKGYNNVVSSNGNSTAQKIKFGGKEYQDELGLEWYDVSARNYDPALGRWMNLDPLAEQMRRHSPYNYAFDNPIYFIDPDGMAPMSNDWIDNKDGTWTAEKGDSAATLATDAGISEEKANELVQEQHGENYEGADGEMKSDIDKDDIVDVNSKEIKAEKVEKAEKKKQEEIKTTQNDKSSKSINKLNDKIDSLSKEITKSHKRMENYNAMNDFARKYEKGDPGGPGLNMGYSMSASRNESDSVKNVNKRTKIKKKRDSIKKSILN